MPATGCVGVGPRLDGPGVVAGGDDHGNDAVHDPLVVGGGPVGIGGGEGVGGNHFVHDFFSAHGLLLEHGPGAGQTAVGQIGEDAQLRAAAGQLLQEGGHGLGPWC